MNSPISWVGGKKALREEVVQHFPFHYENYIEVFGGGGWVLFYKQKRRDFEVYNDANGLLVNLYRCIQSRRKVKRLKKLLQYSLNSREEFNRMRLALQLHLPMSDVRRAAYFYQVIRYSYSSGLMSFASQPHDIRSDFPLIDQATARLAEVVIENADFQKLIRHYDRKASLFYCDPPYHNSEKFYHNIGGFTERDHIRLRDTLLSIEGKFLLSYNDDAFIRNLYRHEKVHMIELKRLHNMRQRFEGGAEFPELLIANYDLNDPSRLLMGQTTLFQPNGGLLVP